MLATTRAMSRSRTLPRVAFITTDAKSPANPHKPKPSASHSTDAKPHKPTQKPPSASHFTDVKPAAAGTSSASSTDASSPEKTAATIAVVDTPSDSPKAILYHWNNSTPLGVQNVGYVLAYAGKLDDVMWRDQPIRGGSPRGLDYPLSLLHQPPLLIDDRVALSSPGSIMRYLTRKLGIGQDLNLEDWAKSEELVETTGDADHMITKTYYAPNKKDAVAALFGDNGALTKMLTAWEPFVNERSGFFGSVATPGDLSWASTLNAMAKLQPGILDEFPKQKAFHEKIQENEGVKEANRRLPFDWFRRSSSAPPAAPHSVPPSALGA
jgi:glutathione S-transferase